MEQTLEWSRKSLLSSPLFVPLHPVAAGFGDGDFPALHDLNALLAVRHPPISVHSGMPLRFVAQQTGKLPLEDQYEPRCYLRGEVQTRAGNLHDLFNALVWLTFPKIKSVINARHYHELTSGSELPTNAGRGNVRDVNTLFDESGVIVVYADAELAGLLRNFKWKELFWQRRERVRTGMGFYLFGHGLYEKALRPYIGMTGQGLLLAVEPEFFSWQLAQQLAHVDGLLADQLAQPGNFCSTRDLLPVPLLGIPGWAADTNNATYYDNAAYFRPGRRE